MNKADDILKLAHAYAIKGEYEPFRAAVESLAADAARTDELKLVANLLNEYGLQALDVVSAFKTAAPRTALTDWQIGELARPGYNGFAQQVLYDFIRFGRAIEAAHGITASKEAA